jgi:hypothetical protein
MYPSVNALLGTWRFMTAARVAWRTRPTGCDRSSPSPI